MSLALTFLAVLCWLTCCICAVGTIDSLKKHKWFSGLALFIVGSNLFGLGIVFIAAIGNAQ